MYMKLVNTTELLYDETDKEFKIHHILKFAGFVSITTEMDKLRNDFPGIVIVHCRKFDNPEAVRGFECHCIFFRRSVEQKDAYEFREICNHLSMRMRAPGKDFPRNLYIGV